MKSFIASLLFAFIFALKISLLNAATNREQLEPFDSQMLDLIHHFYLASSKFPRISFLTLSEFFMNIGKICIPTDEMATSPEINEYFSLCVELFYSTLPSGVLQEGLLLAFNLFFDNIKNLFLRAFEGHIAFPKNYETSRVLWQTFAESAEHSVTQHNSLSLQLSILSICSFLSDQWIALLAVPIRFFVQYKKFMHPSIISNVFFYLSPRNSVNKNFHLLVMHQLFFYDALVRIFELVESFPLCLPAYSDRSVKLPLAKLKEERKNFGQSLEALIFQSPLFNSEVYSIAQNSYCKVCLDEFLKSSLFTAYQSVLHSLLVYEDNATFIGTELSGNLKNLKVIVSQNSSPQVTLAALDPVILELKEEATNNFEILFEFSKYLRLFDDPAKASLIWRPILICPDSSLLHVQGNVDFYICRIFAILIKAYGKIEDGFLTCSLTKLGPSSIQMWSFIQDEMNSRTEDQFWFQRRSRLKKSKFSDHLKGSISKKVWISDDFLLEIEENILSITHILFLSQLAQQEINPSLQYSSAEPWLLNTFVFAFEAYSEMQEQIKADFQKINGSFARHSADIRKLLSIFMEAFLECFCKLGEVKVKVFSSKTEVHDAFSRLFQYRAGLADIITLNSNDLSPWKHLFSSKHKLKCQCHTCRKNAGDVDVRVAILKWQEERRMQVLRIFRRIHYDILIEQIGSFNRKLALTLKSLLHKKNTTFNIQEMYDVLQQFYGSEEDSSMQTTIQSVFSVDLRQKFTSLDFILKPNHSGFEEFFNTFQLKNSTRPKEDPTKVPSFEQNIIDERIYSSQTLEVYKSLFSNFSLNNVPSDSPSKRVCEDTVTAKGLILGKKELEAQIKSLEIYIDCISDIL